MSTPTSYHKIIRKIVVAFADLFNNVVLIRENKDGSENERFIVPIAYATKEKYFDRIEGDPEANKKIQLTLPRFSYELTGFSYDSSRKLNTNIKTFSNAPNGGVYSQYNPVPYNFNFSLNLYTRTIDDASQIIENILPYFTPDYTLRLNLIPEMGIVKEIPIVLDSSNYDIGYEGDYDSEVRNVYWTLNFTVKGYLFGGIQQQKIIKETIQNLYVDSSLYDEIITLKLTPGGYGLYKEGEIVYQGLNLNSSSVSGLVYKFDEVNHTLKVKLKYGSFTLGYPIRGIESLSSWELLNISKVPHLVETITTTPLPEGATPSDNYTYNEVITYGNE